MVAVLALVALFCDSDPELAREGEGLKGVSRVLGWFIFPAEDTGDVDAVDVMLILREERRIEGEFAGSPLPVIFVLGKSLLEAMVVRRVLTVEERELARLPVVAAGAFCFLSLSCIWLVPLSLARGCCLFAADARRLAGRDWLGTTFRSACWQLTV